MAAKLRVHHLAKELSVSSKAIVEKCQAEGVDVVKNHMSALSAGLAATIREWFSEGADSTAVETSERVDLKKVRKPRKRKTAPAKPAASEEEDGGGTATAVAESEGPPTADAEPAAAADSPGEDDTGADSAVAEETPPQPEPEPEIAEVQTPPVETPPAAEAPVTPAEAPSAPVAPTTTQPVVPDETPEAPAETKAKPRKKKKVAAEAPEAPDPVKPAGEKNVPSPAKLQGPRVVRYEPMEPQGPPPRRAPARTREAGPAAGGDDPNKAGRRRRGGSRRASSGGDGPGWRDRDLMERQERLAGATGRRIHRRRAGQTGGGTGTTPIGPKTEATVNEPVKMKEFCAATGLSFMQLFKVLKDEHNTMGNINMTLPTETAQLLALHFGIELTVVPAKTKVDELREQFEAFERGSLKPRSPVVTMLGHVDHGKTSLLDAIRRARTTAKEDGGITQHIGAYHVDTPHGKVTFVDTPGHEAFTAMRSRGAKVTDVVVLVVAADDGVMPQTVEAINHAKAAEVPIVVALNKSDLGDQNKLKIYGQLAEHGLTPSGDWGGEVDVIETSATTNRGIKELIEHLSDLASVLELKADPSIPASGTVLEAETKPGVGAVARVLVKEGTLKVGSFVVCGNAAGKVRALLDDRGKRINKAGPSIPVEVWGLDDVPQAGDTLYQVDSLQRAKDVAAETKHGRIEESRHQSRKGKTLEEMFRQRDVMETPELNIIIKADVDGSLAALKQMLSELPSDEVRLTIRHMGVGGVNDSDVLLAAACAGIIVAYRVDTSVGARRLAEEHGVDIRPYRVVYNVCDDVKKALEGLLAPEEKPETRGTAEVRQVFHLSRGKGLVAGSIVTSGALDRNHLAKVIRDGVVVREGAKFASLRRFKDDVKEVRSGLECGIRLEGFDDIKVGDVIEAYEVIQIARTL